MGSHLPPNFDGVFDPEATANICLAFDRTCSGIHGMPSDYLKDLIARRVIAIARRGEKDPDRLAAATLLSFGIKGE
jgi:hypothetical protein